MNTLTSAARSIVVTGDWRESLVPALDELTPLQPDLVLLFASSHHVDDLPEIVAATRQAVQPRVMLGCTGIGILADAQEWERTPAIALLGVSLPGATLHATRVTQSHFQPGHDAAQLREKLGVAADESEGWLLLADPFHLDPEVATEALVAAYPNVAIIGGIASPGPRDRETRVVLNGDVYIDGGVALSIGGGYGIVPVVSQGADPIGEAWTITSVEGQWVSEIAGRPALEVLKETLAPMSSDERRRAQHNLLVGLAADEYRDRFHRGDFLIRSIVGIDQATGAIAIGALPRLGQTIQFQIRDAAAADLDLHAMLDVARIRLDDRPAVAGILCTCTGRGEQLFGTPHHDARAVSRGLDDLPIAGLFCAGEIGPIGGKAFLHGHTAAIAVIVKTGE